MIRTARKLWMFAFAAVAAGANAQVPDLISAFDAGGKAMGAGGALNTTTANTLSATYNPAGLGYVSQRTAEFAARTFPNTLTNVTGPLTNLRLDTDEEEGDLAASHVGVAVPLSGNRGTLGVAWTTVGWMNDRQLGSNLPGGIQTYFDNVRIKTDLVSIAWGRASQDMRTSFGVGLVIAAHSIYNRQIIVFSDPNIPTVDTTNDDSTFGIGVQAGLLFTPANRSNVSLSLVGRTPIDVEDDGGAIGLYSRIPGRIALGLAVRQDGYRGGRDYAVWGGELQYFFDAKGSERVPREDYAVGHVGVEYNHVRESFVLPIRLGYMILPAGGETFTDRNTFTFGLGYRPINQNWYIELNGGRPARTGGGTDFAIHLGYRF